MFKYLIIRLLITFYLIIIIPVQPVPAQFEGISTQELKAYALADYKDGHYASAFNKYGELIKRYPKDGVFHYYSGLCLFYMNKTIPNAIKFLQFATTRPNVPADVYYYLGEAYMQNYQFPEAKKAYTQFTDVATKTELKELTPSRKAEMAGNAILISKQYNAVEIITSSLFNFRDSSYIHKIGATGGTLGFKPGELKSLNEKEGSLSNYCFISRNPVKGDYLYYSGYGKSAKRGADLFRVKIMGDKIFSEPEPLEYLSSAYNDILPYFDPVGKDLYFASEGYSSMGGYDIFKSHLNPEDNTWSEPLNLGFPVNSPSNEYIFIPGTDLGSILLITDRQGLDTMITAYLLRVREPKRSSSGEDSEGLKRIGKFGGIESIPDIINIAEKGINTGDSLLKSSRLKPVESRPVIRKDIQSSPEYNANLKIALNYQFKSDSLYRSAREARIKVKTLPDPDERWAIQSKIILWEKQASEYQAKADEYYAIVRKLETGKQIPAKIPVAVKKDTTINKPKQEVPSGQIKKPDSTVVINKSPVKAEKSLIESKPSPEKGEGNQFEILEKSPYSEQNPFPADIKIPSGSFYRIQLGVFSKKVEWNAFGGLFPITSETVPGKSMIRFYAGEFTNFERAKAALNVVKGKGYKECFIAAWYNGQKLAPEKVAEFEKRDGR